MKSNKLVASYEGKYQQDRHGEPMRPGTVSIQLYAPEDGIGCTYLYFKDTEGRHTKALIDGKVNEVADLVTNGRTDKLIGYLNHLYWEGDSENLLK